MRSGWSDLRALRVHFYLLSIFSTYMISVNESSISSHPAYLLHCEFDECV